MNKEYTSHQLTDHSDVSHYYGDIIRVLFITASIIILGTLPILKESIPVPHAVSLAFVVAVGIAAGLTSPQYQWIMAVDAFISFLGVGAFEYAAISLSQLWGIFFWTNQSLAIIFFITLYYSVKSLRWMMRF